MLIIMGTNFYANIKMRQRDKDTLQKHLAGLKNALSQSDAGKFDEKLDDLVYDFGEVKEGYIVHLGKRSYGWAFLWDLNGMKYYEPSLSSIMKFLQENNAVITDEYGKEYTVKQFLEEEIGPSLHPSNKPVTKADLDKMQLNDARRKYIIEEYINKGKPYYMYCTHATYYEMHPDEDTTGGFRADANMLSKCQPYSIYKLRHDDTDFVTRDNLRFALFTDFS